MDNRVGKTSRKGRPGVREVARYVGIESGGSLAHVSHVPEFGVKSTDLSC
jgi:hypothetical protein